MLYRIVLWAPLQNEPGWSIVDSRVVGTRRAAKLRAEALLRPYGRTETGYSARVSRGASVDVEARDTGARLFTVDAPVHIVPSVGELGWTP